MADEDWTQPSDTKLRQILESTESIAIVGASSNPARASNLVAAYLLSPACDYRVYLVNPTESEILGQPAYPTLSDLPQVPDLVDVFRRPEHLLAVAHEAVAVGAKSFWTQFGLVDDEAAAVAIGAGLDVVMDRCTKVEHSRLIS